MKTNVFADRAWVGTIGARVPNRWHAVGTVREVQTERYRRRGTYVVLVAQPFEPYYRQNICSDPGSNPACVDHSLMIFLNFAASLEPPLHNYF